jgi:hypothetical protein
MTVLCDDGSRSALQTSSRQDGLRIVDVVPIAEVIEVETTSLDGFRGGGADGVAACA